MSLSVSLSMWAESRRDTTGVAINVGRIMSGHYMSRCRDTASVTIKVGRITSGHYRCRYQMWAELRRSTTCVAVNVSRIMSGHYRCHYRDTTSVTINVGRITSGHYRCRYQCGQNHVGSTTGVAVNVGRITSGHYRCHYRDTTSVAINVGRITSGHYRCRYQCGQNHVGTLQVSLSMWAGSGQDTTTGAITVVHPASPNSVSDEKTREESRVTAGRNRCCRTRQRYLQ